MVYGERIVGMFLQHLLEFRNSVRVIHVVKVVEGNGVQGISRPEHKLFGRRSVRGYQQQQAKEEAAGRAPRTQHRSLRCELRIVYLKETVGPRTTKVTVVG